MENDALRQRAVAVRRAEAAVQRLSEFQNAEYQRPVVLRSRRPPAPPQRDLRYEYAKQDPAGTRDPYRIERPEEKLTTSRRNDESAGFFAAFRNEEENGTHFSQRNGYPQARSASADTNSYRTAGIKRRGMTDSVASTLHSGCRSSGSRHAAYPAGSESAGESSSKANARDRRPRSARPLHPHDRCPAGLKHDRKDGGIVIGELEPKHGGDLDVAQVDASHERHPAGKQSAQNCGIVLGSSEPLHCSSKNDRIWNHSSSGSLNQSANIVASSDPSLPTDGYGGKEQWRSVAYSDAAGRSTEELAARTKRSWRRK
eukprot:gnl/MRDRNA2_/MRDRNA2_131801_c0_seq1.p1 gnl/MRDRNA2_/MRDRNA2_131801_c0~~gnl/MRDRNA2_/MRDRNA2_131801_c0_seq1.p1  ORF type:complete len:314 (+),score=45.70 gnl/MRDRNA2_/MRDRNA2_131801_c0_seq1:130-1071(+)